MRSKANCGCLLARRKRSAGKKTVGGKALVFGRSKTKDINFGGKRINLVEEKSDKRKVQNLKAEETTGAHTPFPRKQEAIQKKRPMKKLRQIRRAEGKCRTLFGTLEERGTIGRNKEQSFLRKKAYAKGQGRAAARKNERCAKEETT